MRMLRIAAILPVILCSAPGTQAADLKLAPFPGPPGYLWVGHGAELTWRPTGLGPQTKMKVELLRSGTLVRVLAPAFPLVSTPQGLMGIFWVQGPTQSDVGCAYAVRVSTQDGLVSATTPSFGIFDAETFKDAQGHESPYRLDSPNSGVLIRGQTVTISWSHIVAPYNTSVKVKLELYYQNAKVGDIAEVPALPSTCPIRGTYPWVVGRLSAVTNPAMAPDGKNVIAGNSFQIRVANVNAGYLGGTFVIALTSGKPGPGGTPLPQVTLNADIKN